LIPPTLKGTYRLSERLSVPGSGPKRSHSTGSPAQYANADVSSVARGHTMKKQTDRTRNERAGPLACLGGQRGGPASPRVRRGAMLRTQGSVGSGRAKNVKRLQNVGRKRPLLARRSNCRNSQNGVVSSPLPSLHVWGGMPTVCMQAINSGNAPSHIAKL
jgi:hypothetical protein